MGYEGIVFDIDNTIVPDGSYNVPYDDVVEGFTCLDNDVIAIAATGRTLDYALPVTSQLKLHHESIVANGAQIINSQNGDILYQTSLSKNAVEYILSLCLEIDKDFQFCIAGDPIGSVISVADQSPRESPGVFLINIPLKSAMQITEILNDNPEYSVYVSTNWIDGTNSYDVNIGHAYAEKGTALRYLLRKKDVDVKKIIAVGDGINDIGLFAIAGYRIAVEGSHPELLKIADEIIPSHNNLGILEVLRRFQ